MRNTIAAAITTVAVITAASLVTVTSADKGVQSAQETPKLLPDTSVVVTPEVSPEPTPAATATPEPSKAPEPAPTPAPTCASEILKYTNWNQTTFHNIMLAESGGDVQTRNDNINTGDYSIGCFQINLLGSANLISKYGLAKNAGYTGDMTVEGLEPWLKNPVNNVNVANQLWAGNGYSPWRYTCATKVACY